MGILIGLVLIVFGVVVWAKIEALVRVQTLQGQALEELIRRLNRSQ